MLVVELIRKHLKDFHWTLFGRKPAEPPLPAEPHLYGERVREWDEKRSEARQTPLAANHEILHTPGRAQELALKFQNEQNAIAIEPIVWKCKRDDGPVLLENDSDKPIVLEGTLIKYLYLKPHERVTVHSPIRELVTGHVTSNQNAYQRMIREWNAKEVVEDMITSYIMSLNPSFHLFSGQQKPHEKDAMQEKWERAKKECPLRIVLG